MPRSDFKCDVCGFQFEVHFSGAITEEFEQAHQTPKGKSCKNKTLFRVWTTFRTGRGTSGGTPPR